MPGKKFRQVCTCTNCGNDAEMEITCSLQEEPDQPLFATQTAGPPEDHLAKGQVSAAIAGTKPTCGSISDPRRFPYVSFGPNL
jgi:hypothetical protein